MPSKAVAVNRMKESPSHRRGDHRLAYVFGVTAGFVLTIQNAIRYAQPVPLLP